VQAVGGVEDGKFRFVAEVRRFLAQDGQPQRVEGGDGQAARVLALQQLADALLHLARRFVGEGDGGNVDGRVAAFLDQVGDLVGDHPRLAAAGTGQHQEGAVEILYRFALRGIEVGEHASGMLSLGADFNPDYPLGREMMARQFVRQFRRL